MRTKNIFNIRNKTSLVKRIASKRRTKRRRYIYGGANKLDVNKITSAIEAGSVEMVNECLEDMKKKIGCIGSMCNMVTGFDDKIQASNRNGIRIAFFRSLKKLSPLKYSDNMDANEKKMNAAKINIVNLLWNEVINNFNQLNRKQPKYEEKNVYYKEKNVYYKERDEYYKIFHVLYAGNNTFHLASYCNNIEMFNFIFKQYSPSSIGINAQNTNGNTPLHIAVITNHNDMVELLLANKADVNAQNTNGNTPLHIAAITKNNNMVELLLDKKGADINTNNKYDGTPLHIAVSADNKELVKLLLDNKADINAQTHKYGTPLHIAVSKSNNDMVELLLDNKADINAQNEYICTPLHNAVSAINNDMVKLLLAKGANVNAKNEHIGTPLHIAAQTNTNFVELLLANYADVNAQNLKKNTPLHNAAKTSTEIVELLLANGADVNTQNVDSDTPLTIALRDMRHLDTAITLVEYLPQATPNATPNTTGKFFISPLVLAADKLLQIGDDNNDNKSKLELIISTLIDKTTNDNILVELGINAHKIPELEYTQGHMELLIKFIKSSNKNINIDDELRTNFVKHVAEHKAAAVINARNHANESYYSRSHWGDN